MVLSPGKFGTIHTHSQEGQLARVEAIFSCLCLQKEAPVRVTERPGCYLALLQCGRPAPQQSHPAPNANSKVLRQTFALLKPTIAVSSSESDSSTSLALRILPGIWSFVCEPCYPLLGSLMVLVIFIVKICYWLSTWNSSEQLNTVLLSWSFLAEGGRQVPIICAVECLNSFYSHHLNLDTWSQAIQTILHILRVHSLGGFHQRSLRTGNDIPLELQYGPLKRG